MTEQQYLRAYFTMSIPMSLSDIACSEEQYL
jgi:hypothetical protein